ncbi:hypothetical protein [Nonomuraea wenchangensis]|uniref:hypothetical protein n=1 Tax=Nonomuraea wenchangensis TaxID=568860 RepID=UPI00332F2FEB
MSTNTTTVSRGQPAPVHVPVPVAELVEHLARRGVLLDDEIWDGAEVTNAVIAFLQSYGLSV